MSIEGRVVKIISDNEVVANIGTDNGVSDGNHFLVFVAGDEIVDPETKESLGRLEVVRGRGEVKHLQERMTTIRSIEKRNVLRDRERPSIYPAFRGLIRPDMETVEVNATVPFQGVKVGDLVRIL